MLRETSPSIRSRVASVTITCAVFVSLLATPAAARAQSASPDPPGPVYLSLGDSMAFGLQFDRLFEMLDAGTYTPDAFNTGYTDALGTRLQQLRSDQQTINLSCPGESAVTMIAGDCFFTMPEPDGPGLTLHTSYAGTQLDAAIAFLQSHADEVNPITLTIGGNDVATVIADECNFDAACVTRSGVRDALGRNLDHIVQALQAAAPNTEIVLIAFYNPFTVDAPATDGLWQRNYTHVQQAAAARNSVRVVDVSHILKQSNVCELTFMCSSGDPHPTDLGYRVIADEVFKGAGYE